MTFDPSCGSYRQTRCRELWPSPLGRTSARWRGVRSSIQWKLITFASMKPGGRNSWSVWRWNLEGFGVTRFLHICLFTYGVQWHSRTQPRCETLVCFISWNNQRSLSSYFLVSSSLAGRHSISAFFCPWLPGGFWWRQGDSDLRWQWRCSSCGAVRVGTCGASNKVPFVFCLWVPGVGKDKLECCTKC